MFQETIWGLANAAEMDCVLIAAGTKLQGVWAWAGNFVFLQRRLCDIGGMVIVSR